MTGELATAVAPFALAALFVAVPVLIGKAIKHGGVPARPAELPNWLADLDFPDDGADARRSPATEAAHRQALALDEPDPAFIARTRRVVIDELARRRAGAR